MDDRSRTRSRTSRRRGPKAPSSPQVEEQSEGLTRRNLINMMSVVGTAGAAGVLPQTVSEANAADLGTIDKSASSIRQTEALTPMHFGAAVDPSADNARALNDFFAAAANDRSYRYCAAGEWAAASPLMLDASGTGLEMDFGNCRIRALTPMPRLLTVQNNFNSKFSGRLNLRGTNYGSDACTDWTCDVGLYAKNIAQAKFDELVIEGFGYAAVESERASNDSVHWGHITAVRVGSGDPHLSRSLSVNWSGPAHSGAYGSVTQFTKITVDRLPIAYVQSNSSGVPDRTILVEIGDRLFFVTHIDPSSKALRVYPRLAAAMGSSGVLRYHYGGALVLRGGDSNIDTFEQISCVGGSTGLELSCLYGASGGIVHTEACGSNMRVGAKPGNVMWGAFIGQRYCDGTSFNYVQVTRSASQVFIGASPATAPPSKDIDISGPLSSSNGREFYTSEGLIGLTFGAPEGWHFRRKRFVDRANENLDFGDPRTFNNPVFYTGPGGSASFRLVPPGDGLREQFGLDCAQVTIIGPGANGQPSDVRFIPPNGQRINRGAPSAPAFFTGFAGVARLAIYHDGAESWIVR